MHEQMEGQTTVDEQIEDGEFFDPAAVPEATLATPEGMTREQARELIADFEIKHHLTPEQRAIAYQAGEFTPEEIRASEGLDPVGPEAFELTDEAAAALGQQVNIPMQQIVLTGAPVRIGTNDDNTEKAIIVGPIAFTFVLPLTNEGARNVGRGLTGGIEIATGLPAKLELAR